MSAKKEYLNLVRRRDADSVASRLLLTSDIHTSGLNSVKPRNGTEIVVLAGDFMGAGMESVDAGRRWLDSVFWEWAIGLKEKGIDIVIIPGNHDKHLWRAWHDDEEVSEKGFPSNCHYLINCGCTVKGLKFYGMPWCENDRPQRFECSAEDMARYCSKIPSGLDVLVTHCPPAIPGEDIDVQKGVHEGSVAIADAILRAKPKLCVCGHVHGGSRDKVILGDTIVMNVARVKGDRSKGDVSPKSVDLEAIAMDAIDEYLEAEVRDSKLPKNETLEEHRKHCKAEKEDCPFEANEDNTDRVEGDTGYEKDDEAYMDAVKRGDEYANARTEKLAPNGKRSNLSNALYHLVRTKSFKKWFGDCEIAHLLNVVERSLEDKNYQGKFVFSPSQKVVDALKDILGRNTSEFVITADTIRHVVKRHGNEKAESSRGQVAISVDDLITLPYVLNNFDAIVRAEDFDDKLGNKAVDFYKRINGVSVVATISRGNDKQFVVTNWRLASTVSMPQNVTPKLNALSDVDISSVAKNLDEINRSARKASKVIDENGEPLPVWHGTNKRFYEFRKDKQGYDPGFFFAENRTRPKEGWTREYAEYYGGITMPVFLRNAENMCHGEWRVNEPTDIKSADPVTYDDAGNVIPLSKRFDFSSSDIRY